jgi:hypothetical protein
VSETDRIRSLNDSLRTSFQGGKVMLTRGVQGKGEEFVAKAMTAMREFSDFTEDNDPHGEHDFGGFTVDGEECFFKVDYYNQDMSAGSERPDDASQTTRVLTLLLANEY